MAVDGPGEVSTESNKTQRIKPMKRTLMVCTAAAVLGLFPPNTNIAATQVYDLNADWSVTENPNGTWSYREGETLLTSDPLPWVGAAYDPGAPVIQWPPQVPAMEKVAGEVSIYGATYSLSVYLGVLESDDILVVPGANGNILWTAPVSGTIDISGSAWVPDSFVFCSLEPEPLAFWSLAHNGNPFSSGGVSSSLCFSFEPRNFPDEFILGSGGATALQNISVASGDQIVLSFSGSPVGVNLTITLTPDSVDPVTALHQLAETVALLNLQNGIENSLDSKLDATLNALDDLNMNNHAAACNSLAAFISAVEAQRDNKINSAEADALIAAAQQLMATLNCGN